MPQIPAPSELLKCQDLTSCFQSLYNLFFAIFLALAFLSFVYGAVQYLLSGAGVFQKEEGKKRMINSIIALILVLITPVILNMINPNIFKTELLIPKIKKIVLPIGDVLLAVEVAEKDLTDEEINRKIEPPYIRRGIYPEMDACEINKATCDVKRIGLKFSNITFANNDNGGTEYINKQLFPILFELDRKLQEKDIRIVITDGYSPADHKSKCHTRYGTCIDVIVVDSNGNLINPSDKSWVTVKEIAKVVGFYVLDERFKEGSKFWTGVHLHLDART